MNPPPCSKGTKKMWPHVEKNKSHPSDVLLAKTHHNKTSDFADSWYNCYHCCVVPQFMHSRCWTPSWHEQFFLAATAAPISRLLFSWLELCSHSTMSRPWVALCECFTLNMNNSDIWWLWLKSALKAGLPQKLWSLSFKILFYFYLFKVKITKKHSKNACSTSW